MGPWSDRKLSGVHERLGGISDWEGEAPAEPMLLARRGTRKNGPDSGPRPPSSGCMRKKRWISLSIMAWFRAFRVGGGVGVQR